MEKMQLQRLNDRLERCMAVQRARDFERERAPGTIVQHVAPEYATPAAVALIEKLSNDADVLAHDNAALTAALAASTAKLKRTNKATTTTKAPVELPPSPPPPSSSSHGAANLAKEAARLKQRLARSDRRASTLEARLDEALQSEARARLDATQADADLALVQHDSNERIAALTADLKAISERQAALEEEIRDEFSDQFRTIISGINRDAADRRADEIGALQQQHRAAQATLGAALARVVEEREALCADVGRLEQELMRAQAERDGAVAEVDALRRGRMGPAPSAADLDAAVETAAALRAAIDVMATPLADKEKGRYEARCAALQAEIDRLRGASCEGPSGGVHAQLAFLRELLDEEDVRLGTQPAPPNRKRRRAQAALSPAVNVL